MWRYYFLIFRKDNDTCTGLTQLDPGESSSISGTCIPVFEGYTASAAVSFTLYLANSLTFTIMIPVTYYAYPSQDALVTREITVPENLILGNTYEGTATFTNISTTSTNINLQTFMLLDTIATYIEMIVDEGTNCQGLSLAPGAACTIPFTVKAIKNSGKRLLQVKATYNEDDGIAAIAATIVSVSDS